MAAAQDLYVQLKISDFRERCYVWKISDRRIYTDLQDSKQTLYWCPVEILMYALQEQPLVALCL